MAVALVAVIGLPAAAQPTSIVAVRPTVTPPAVWGWVVARQPTTNTYIPSAPNQGNSSGGANQVTRLAQGQYEVKFSGVGESQANEGGIVHVTALSAESDNCQAHEWDAATADELVYVTCKDLQGHFVDSAFSVDWVDPLLDDGEMAFVWVANGTSGLTAPYYSFNSSGGTNTVTRSATGRYAVLFPGMDGTKGDVQVTAYGTSAICHAADWHAQASDIVVDVQCRKPDGSFADARFDTTYLFHLAFQGAEGPSQAYLLADQPRTASYHPAIARRFSSAGLASTVKRTSAGRYAVALPGMPAGGAVQVTAYGPGKQACRITTIRTQTPQQVGVLCTNPAGTAVDSAFSLAYTH